jgi:hypothetical protein
MTSFNSLHDRSSASGQLKTLDCAFELDSDTGEQVGELESVGQLVPDGDGGLRMARAWHLTSRTENRSTALPVPQTNAAWAAALTWRPKNGDAEEKGGRICAAASAALFADTP